MSNLIIIAEDDPFISRMYQIKLELAGYSVVIKTNGRDAYEAIKTDHPVLAMLDINMPEMTGLEVLAALSRDNFDMKATPMIVLTNSSRDDDRALATRYGADYVIKAELTPRQVLDMISLKAPLEEA